MASSVLLFCFLSKSFVVTNFTVSCIVLSYCLVIKSLTVCKSLLNLSSFSESNSLTLFSTPSVVLSANSLNFIPEKYLEKRVKNIIEIPPIEKIRIIRRNIIDRLNKLIKIF